MSYNDDELKIGEVGEDDVDLDVDPGIDLGDPLDEDIAALDEEDSTSEGFAGLDGAEY